MSRLPLVSIVLPTRNAAGTIDRALESLMRQTFANWEAVVVDDGSVDETCAKLDAAARADPRIRVVAQPPRGIVAALNVGLREAQGAFIARLDADDAAHPERLEAQVSFLRARPEIGLVSSLVGFGGDPLASAGYAHHVDWLNRVVTEDELALNRFVESPLAHPSVMFRREVWERHGGYEEGDWPEDYELWLRWAEAGVRMAKVPRELLVWHDSPGRASRTDPRYRPDAFYRVKAKYLASHLARAAVQRVWIWGAGRPTRQRAAYLVEHGLQINGYIDVDAKKVGKRVSGVPVVGPDQLPSPGDAFILGYVASRGARELIRAELTRRSWTEGRNFLMCA